MTTKKKRVDPIPKFYTRIKRFSVGIPYSSEPKKLIFFFICQNKKTVRKKVTYWGGLSLQGNRIKVHRSLTRVLSPCLFSTLLYDQ